MNTKHANIYCNVSWTQNTLINIAMSREHKTHYTFRQLTNHIWLLNIIASIERESTAAYSWIIIISSRGRPYRVLFMGNYYDTLQASGPIFQRSEINNSPECQRPTFPAIEWADASLPRGSLTSWGATLTFSLLNYGLVIVVISERVPLVVISERG